MNSGERYLVILVLSTVAFSGCDKRPPPSSLSSGGKEILTAEPDWRALVSRLPLVELPFTYTAWRDPKFDLVELSSAEQLLFHDDHELSGTAVGLLPDTARYFHVLWMGAADDMVPMVTTFSKEGQRLTQESLIVGKCGPPDPCFSCSETTTISSDLKIVSIDTLRECRCDSLSEPIPNTCERYILRKEGSFDHSGRLVLKAVVRTDLDVD